MRKIEFYTEYVSKKMELIRKYRSVIKDEDDFDCPICLCQPEKIVRTHCNHVFCESCILKIVKEERFLFPIYTPCPICRRPLSRSRVYDVPQPTVKEDDLKKLINSNVEDDLQTLINSKPNLSAKIKKLLQLFMASKEANPSIKSVVFSQFRKMLILLEKPLKAAGFRVLHLDASMSIKKKTEVIQEFGKNGSNSSTILLATLKAACAGINLTAASRVYLIDPWLTPSIEEQAISRVHRLGQNEEVRVIRLIVKNSIEDMVLQLQEQKKILAGGATLVGRKNSKSQANMRLNEICTMMSL